MNWMYYRKLFDKLKKSGDSGSLDQLAMRLAAAEEAVGILANKGYEGSDLADQVKKVPPASLKHS